MTFCPYSFSLYQKEWPGHSSRTILL